jgi:hypothetical protein
MVRRRKSKSKDSKPGPRPFDKRDGTIKRWNTLEDIPMDEEDQCARSFCPSDLPDDIHEQISAKFTHPGIVFYWKERKLEPMMTGTRMRYLH